MLELKVRSKFVDLSQSYKLYYVLAIGMFVTTLSYVLYRDIIVTVTLALSTLVTFLVFKIPPEEMKVQANEDLIIINGDRIPYEKIIAWSVIDLGDDLEFVIRTNLFAKDYYFFYVNENLPEVAQLLLALTEMTVYDEDLIRNNIIHRIQRRFGLK